MAGSKNTLESQLRGAEVLLKNKADVNAKNNLGNNALMMAIFFDYQDLARILINWGSDVSIVAGGSTTALHFPCLSNDSKLVKLLLKKGTPIDVQNEEGRTALMWVLLIKRPSNKLDTLKALLKKDPDVNTIDLSGNNILTINPDLDNESLKVVLEHLAKMDTLNLSLHQNILNTIKNKTSFNNYFAKCKKELSEAKNSKIHDFSVTYFDLLRNDKKKLMNYAKNESLVQYLENSDYKKFKIFGPYMQKNMAKAVKRCKMHNSAAKSLRECLPMNPPDLVIDKIINLFDKLDLKKLSQDV